MLDVIIIGSGAGGISASLYLKRAGITPLVFAKKSNSSLTLAKEIENYYGTGRITGKELYDNGIKQAVDIGVEIRYEEVFAVTHGENGGFCVNTDVGEYNAKNVIIATGITRNTPKIEGLKQFEGAGVSYCAVCDGFFFRKKTVGVLGSGKYAIHEAEYLANIVNAVYIFTNGEVLDGTTINPKISIINGSVKKIDGVENLESIVLNNDEKFNIAGLFIALKSAGANELAAKLGLEIVNKHIKINSKSKTNVDGVYAVGDCTGTPYQIAKAVYEGMTAANDIIESHKK